MKYTNIKIINHLLDQNKIKAQIMLHWSKKSNPNCKFIPGNSVKVTKNPLATMSNVFESKKKYQRRGQVGKVIAVSSPDGYTMRSSRNRQFTRYYIAFQDGYVGGFHSHILKST
jgi:hypothetical protein